MPYGFQKKEITLLLFTFKDKGGFTKKVGLLRKLYKYLPVVLLAMVSCGEDEVVKQPSDAEYFPLRKGFYQVYSVHEVEYQLLAETKNVTYQLKTEVIDSFINQEEGYTYTIHRSKRNTPADSWEFQQVWSVRMNTANVVVSEENTPFIKIVFPAVPNLHWDGNALNSLPADEYLLTKTGDSYELSTGITVGEYIQIVQEDSYDPIIFLNKRQEFYARKIGLVSLESIDLEYCTDADDCEVGQQVINNGTIYVQTLMEYGQN